MPDRGDRDLLPDRRRLYRLGDVRAAVAAHPGRSAVSLSAASAGARASTVIDLIRIAFFGYAIMLVWQFIQIIGDERMTTIKFQKVVYYAVLLGFADVCARSRSRSRTGGGAIRSWSARAHSTERKGRRCC